MLRHLVLVVTSASVLFLSAVAFAETSRYGTEAEARVMLDKALAAVRADKAAALDAFNRSEGEFKDRDLYVFCVNASDGIATAHPTNKGQPIQDIKDVKGFAIGEEMMKTATEGTMSEITYLWPRPGSDTPVEKVSFFTIAGDQICGVGYYKE